MSAILAFLTTKIPAWGYAVLAAVLVLVGAYATGHRAARRAAQADHDAQLLKGARDAMQARDRVQALDSDAVRELARSRMRRTGRW